MNVYPSYKNSGVEWIGEIPSEWGVKPLKYVSDDNLHSLGSETDPEYELNYLEISDVDSLGNIKKPTIYTFSKSPSRCRRIVLKDDIIISTVRTYLKSIGFINDEVKDLICSTGFCVITPDKTLILPSILFYMVRMESFISKVISLSEGVSYPSINSDKLVGIKILIPPLQEQQQISDYLDYKTSKIDTLIEKTKQKIELLKEQRISLINTTVTKGFNPNVEMKDSGVEWIGEIPSGWDVVSIKRLCSIKRGSSPRPIDNPDYFDEKGEFSWVRIADVSSSNRYLEKTKQQLSELGSSLSTKRYPGDLFLSIAGTVGKPIITKIKCCIHDGFVWFDDLNTNKEFLYYIFSVDQCFKGLGKMGTQLNLNTDTVGLVKIPLMNTKEQQKIVDYLDLETLKIDKLVDIESKRIKLLKEYRQSLISDVVTGKVDVRDEVLV